MFACYVLPMKFRGGRKTLAYPRWSDEANSFSSRQRQREPAGMSNTAEGNDFTKMFKSRVVDAYVGVLFFFFIYKRKRKDI